MTLDRLRRDMEPAAPEEYADFLIRWQCAHPDRRRAGPEGLEAIIAQLQGQENYQIVFERDVFPARVPDYAPALLDRLCYGGKVSWRRFGHKNIKRGYIGFCLRPDWSWLVPNPQHTGMDTCQWDDDISAECDAVRAYLREKGACFFNDVVEGTGLDWQLALRAIWHLVWTGEATNDSYESIRHAAIASGLSACYDLGTRPGRKGVTLDSIVHHMLDLRHLDPRLGRWAPTERLVPAALPAVEPEDAALRWAHLLLARYGIVCRESVKREDAAPKWRDLRRALIRLELLGQVRRGFFVQALPGEQFAYPEAVESLCETKLRHPDEGDGGGLCSDEPMVLLNACDPANPFGLLFTATNQAGAEVKFVRVPQKYLVFHAGQPVLLYDGAIRLLVDMTAEQTERALRSLLQLVDQPARGSNWQELPIRDWNDHPIDVSPARHLLLKLGFVKGANRWKGFVYDGKHLPDPEATARAEKAMPLVFEHIGKEKAPVRYDAAWIIGRASPAIRDKVRELVAWLHKTLPPDCELVYQPRRFVVRYRGLRCMNPYVQRKQIWLQITHRGWKRGIQIGPDTNLDDPAFVRRVMTEFEATRSQIDAILDPGDQ